MLISKKWTKVVAIALSLPSTIFTMALFTDFLVKENILSKKIAWLLFLVVICNSIIVMVWYALRVKKKSTH